MVCWGGGEGIIEWGMGGVIIEWTMENVYAVSSTLLNTGNEDSEHTATLVVILSSIYEYPVII